MSGRVELAGVARSLIETCCTVDGFAAPGAADPLLLETGAGAAADAGEGAGPSGRTSIAGAAWRLALLTGDRDLLRMSAAALAPHTAHAVEQPIGAGALLGLAVRQLEPIRQIVVVTAGTPDLLDPLVRAAAAGDAAVLAVVDERAASAFADAGFELFEGRVAQGGVPTAYVCEDFVCRLPTTDASAVRRAARPPDGL